MVNALPPPHTIVVYRCCEPSRWGISRQYDFYIEQAINLLYEHYADLPNDIRNNLIIELIKTGNTSINLSQFIEKSLQDEIKCRADRQELHPKYPDRSCI